MNITDIPTMNETNNNITWFPIVTNILILLNIIISLSKQYLNNNKHSTLTDTLKTVVKESLKEGSKEEAKYLVTEAIELNVPENLKSSIRKE